MDRSHQTLLTRSGRPFAAAALLALLASWLLGAAHLMTEHAHGGSCHGGGHGHAHAVVEKVASPCDASLVDLSDECGETDATQFAAAEAEHECAVLHLLATGGGFAPDADGQPRAPAPAARLVDVATQSERHGSVALLLLAPKNSPPARAARVLG